MVQEIKSNPLVRIFLAVLFLGLPLVFSPSLVDEILTPRLLFSSITFCALIIIVLRNREQAFQIRLLGIGILVFLATYLFSIWFAVVPVESIYFICRLFLLGLSYFIFVELLKNSQITEKFLFPLISLFLLIFLIPAIFQVFFLGSHKSVLENASFITSTTGNKNLLSSIIFLCIPFVLLQLRSEKGLIKWLYLSLAVLGFAFIWILQTKAVWLGFLVSGVLFLFLWIDQEKIKWLKSKPLVLTGSIAVILLIAFYTWKNINHLHYLINLHTGYTRIGLWKNTLQMIKEHPWGVGAGNWQIYFPKYGLKIFENDVQQGMMHYQRPHNDFLWVFSEAGPIAFLAYCSLFILPIFYVVFKGSKLSPEKSIKIKLLVATLIGFGVISSLDFPMERVEHMIVFGLLLAIIDSHLPIISFSWKKKFLFIPLFLASIISFFLATERWKGESHSRNLLTAHRNGNWETLIKEATKAESSYYLIDPSSAPLEWYKGVALFATGDLSSAQKSFERAYEIHPYHIHVLNNLAGCLEKEGDHQSAEKFYLEALQISPGFIESKLNLSAVYYNTKQFEKSFKLINECPVNTDDPKYKTFLPAIFKALVIEKLQPSSDLFPEWKNLENDNEKIVQEFLNAKSGSVNFVSKFLTLNNFQLN